VGTKAWHVAPTRPPTLDATLNLTCSLVANQASGSAHIDGRTIPSLRQASSWLYDSPNRCFNTHDGQCHSTFTCPSHKRGCVESIIHRLVATHNAHVPKWAFRTTPGDRRSDSLGDDSRTSYRRGNNVDTCFPNDVDHAIRAAQFHCNFHIAKTKGGCHRCAVSSVHYSG
jgi:hypothetical protein